MATEQGWVITSQVSDQVQVTQAGQPVTGVMVYFATGEGNESSVFVPNASYNKATVRQMVHTQALLVDEIGRMTSGGD